MAFVGSGILITGSTGLGQSENLLRGLDSDGTNLYGLGNSLRRLVRITSLTTFASEIVSAQTPQQVNSLAYHNGSFYFATNTSSTLYKIDPPFTELSANTELGQIDGTIRSLCTDGTNLFGYDRAGSVIRQIVDNETDVDTLTVSEFATIAFPAGITDVVVAMFYFDNAFYFFNNSNDLLYKLPDNLAAGSTDVVPVIVNSGITAYGVSDTAAGGAGTLGDEAYFLGDTNNQLFRLYRIRWDATINNIEVDSGADTTLALGSVSQDALGFSFAPTNTDRSWLTIVGNDLTIISAPDVTTDTDYSVIVRATRSGINVDKTLTVRVAGTGATPAVLTITTTDTDIRAGEAVDINIASDIDVTDFVDSDITVTGGTRGALTGSGTSWTLAVTAGSAGTMTVAIAENAVSPGNTAVSQDFTVTALVTGTITFDDGLGDSGGDTGVNIELSESVTGLALSDFTVVNGTLSNLQGTGTSYTATLNFPASGTNTTTVTLRANTVSPSNAAIVATIIYFQVQTDAVLNITTDQTSVENSEVANVTFTFDSAVTGFTAGDVVVTFGATKGALTNEGNNVYTMPVTAPSTGSGTIVVSVAEDRVSPGNNTDNVSFTYTTPVVALSFGSTISNQAWTVGTAESLTLPEATGGNGAITYSLSPTTPAGITFTAGTRVLAGTPTGRFTSSSFTYTAEDADGTTVDLTFTIVVTATAITFDSGINNQSWTVGTPVSLILPTVSGGVGAFTYSLTPALPAGVTFAAGTRLLSGTPTASGGFCDLHLHSYGC